MPDPGSWSRNGTPSCCLTVQPGGQSNATTAPFPPPSLAAPLAVPPFGYPLVPPTGAFPGFAGGREQAQ
jgi:hypothetical protein